MRRRLLPALLVLLVTLPASAGGGLEALLADLNIQARSDTGSFAARISTQFATPEAQVRIILSQVSQPADAFMVFQLGQLSRKPVKQVMDIYQTRRGRGWGAMAQDLGIRPGSREFHALKRGEFRLGPGDNQGPGKSRGKGKHHRD